MSSSKPFCHVVLFQPEIPQNTGNIGRTCVAVGAKLWLVRPLGFRLEDRYLKRAGMDYWPLLDYEVADDLTTVEDELSERTWWVLTKTASRPVWDAPLTEGDVFLFGSESKGLPASVLSREPARNLTLPMLPAVRSLNLASTVNTVVYEAYRQHSLQAGEAT